MKLCKDALPPHLYPKKLFRLAVVEEFVIATDGDAACDAAGGMNMRNCGVEGTILTEEIAEPMATLFLTKHEIGVLHKVLQFDPTWRASVTVKNKIDQAILQIAVQTVMLEREEA